MEASEIKTIWRKKGSPERVIKKDGAETVYDKEITFT